MPKEPTADAKSVRSLKAQELLSYFKLRRSRNLTENAYFTQLAKKIYLELRDVFNYYVTQSTEEESVHASREKLGNTLRGLATNKAKNYSLGLDVLSCLFFHESLQMELELIISLLTKKEAFDTFINEKITREFILYYWRPELQGEILSGDVNFAKLSLTFNLNNSLINGRLDYFSGTEDGTYTQEDTHTLNLQESETSKNLFLCLQNNELGAMLTIPTEKKNVIHPFCFFSYNIIRQKNYPAAGIGIMEAVINFDKKIKKIIKEGVDAAIYNNLFMRREMIKASEHGVKSKDDIQNSGELKYFSDIEGTWNGIYLRNDRQIDSNECGGIETVLLTIQKNGKVVLTAPKGILDEEQELEGFGSFPRPSKDFLKLNLSFTVSKISSMHIFLHNDNNSILKGVISGWNSFYKPYTGLIYFSRDEADQNKRISFWEKNEIIFKQGNFYDSIYSNGFNPELLAFFKNEDKFLNTPENCLPELYSKYKFNETQVAGLLAGKYFLYSYSPKDSGVMRLKVQIFKNGKVEIESEDAKFVGVASCKKNSDEQDYLFINIVEHISGEQVNPYFGYIIFELGTQLKKYKQNAYENIHFIPGISVRINSQIQIQAKKEYLIPAINEEIFDICHRFSFHLDDIGLTEVRNGRSDGKNGPSRELRDFAISLKGRTENVLKVEKGSVNNLHISSSSRGIKYHEIYFNNFIMLAFLGDHTKDNQNCRKFLLMAINHGLDLQTVESSIKVFYDKFDIDNVRQTEIRKMFTSIAAIARDIDKKGQLSRSIDVLIENLAHGTSQEAKELQDGINKLIKFLNTILLPKYNTSVKEPI